jgi:hypothetical protein
LEARRRSVSEHARVSPAREYDVLQSELAQSRKYVFERPLVIAGVGIALSTRADAQLSAVWPALFAGLLLFNFWFTVQQVRGSCRIVAYIVVVLEGDAGWKGWETSLRQYRIWERSDHSSKMRNVDRELKRRVVPHAMLLSYGPIYLMHVALVALCLAVTCLLAVRETNTTNVVATVVLVLGAGVFARESWACRPSEMRCRLEREIVTWQYVLGLEAQRVTNDKTD